MSKLNPSAQAFVYESVELLPMEVPCELLVQAPPVELAIGALLSCMFVSRNLVLASLLVYAQDAHKVFDEMPNLLSSLLSARVDPLLVVGP
jgi:hypothetical protein